MVERCDLEWRLDGELLGHSSLGGGIPTISIDQQSWSEASERLAHGEEVIPHHSFALDAIYFSQHDPVRGIIMACAAWETALRYYLSNVAAKKDAAYEIAAKLNGIPMLYQFATKARGGDLFFGMQATAGLLADQLERHKKIMQELPSWRNRLLHQGSRKLIPEGGALDAALATLNAIESLFA